MPQKQTPTSSFITPGVVTPNGLDQGGGMVDSTSLPSNGIAGSWSAASIDVAPASVSAQLGLSDPAPRPPAPVITQVLDAVSPVPGPVPYAGTNFDPHSTVTGTAWRAISSRCGITRPCWVLRWLVH
jgi:hypothetical protein